MPPPRTSRPLRPPRRPAAAPAWARRRRSVTTRPQRDWIAITVAALPGLVALIALVFAYLSIRATDDQLQIAEQGQITDRYNAAIANLGSASTDVRLGGIYALQRLMQDSPRDQPTVVAVLCAFVRDHAPAIATLAGNGPRTDVQAALTVVTSRNTANDGSTTIVDLADTQLVGANLVGANLVGADLFSANLGDAYLESADLADANVGDATLTDAELGGANLTHALLTDSDLTGADLAGAYLASATLEHATLGADLASANLTDANLDYATFDDAGPQRREPRRRGPLLREPHRRGPHRRASHRRASHRRHRNP